MQYKLGHPDPLDPEVPRPDGAAWPDYWKDAFGSREMDAFREGLKAPGMPDIRSSVLDDLSTYFDIDAEESLHRATHSYEAARAEWDENPDMVEFHRRTHAWQAGLLWYSYLQAEGYACPVAVIAARDIDRDGSLDTLDFGSGAGTASLMLHQLGHRTTLADISTSLLDFCRHRFERRRAKAEFIDLNNALLRPRSYDVVLAVQVMASIPNVYETSRRLHRALRPRGLLYADFDTSGRAGTVGRLYDDDLPLRRAVNRAGFVESRAFRGATIRHERVRPRGLQHQCRTVRDAVLLGRGRVVWRKLRYNAPLATLR